MLKKNELYHDDTCISLFSPHMTSVVGTLHVGKYMRSRYTFHFFVQILSLFYTDFVAILCFFCRQLGVRRCFVLVLSLFHTTFVAQLVLTLIYTIFVATLVLTLIHTTFGANLYVICRLFVRDSLPRLRHLLFSSFASVTSSPLSRGRFFHLQV